MGEQQILYSQGRRDTYYKSYIQAVKHAKNVYDDASAGLDHAEVNQKRAVMANQTESIPKKRTIKMWTPSSLSLSRPQNQPLHLNCCRESIFSNSTSATVLLKALPRLGGGGWDFFGVMFWAGTNFLCFLLHFEFHPPPPDSAWIACPFKTQTFKTKIRPSAPFPPKTTTYFINVFFTAHAAIYKTGDVL